MVVMVGGGGAVLVCAQASIYEKKSKEVKDVMCWQSYRNLLIIFALLAVIGLVIGLSVWGATKK